MNIKVVIQVVLCILLGYGVKAGEIRPVQQKSPCDNPIRYSQSKAEAIHPMQEESLQVTDQHAPRHKQLKCRTRFRGVASVAVSVSPAPITRISQYVPVAEPLPGTNEDNILLLYYIFLFRFTPF